VADHPQTPSSSLADIRRDYRLAALDEAAAGPDPLALFRRWLAEAERAGLDEVNAFTLATTDADGQPHARTVLLKDFSAETGFVFYTNYASDKAMQMAAQPRVAALFFWKELERQVRIEGAVEPVSGAESDAYFNSRPLGSRIGAWASHQSKPIESREALEEKFRAAEATYAADDVPRPAHWGGYRIIPARIEAWQGRPSRLHDRLLYVRTADDGWTRQRLQP